MGTHTPPHKYELTNVRCCTERKRRKLTLLFSHIKDKRFSCVNIIFTSEEMKKGSSLFQHVLMLSVFLVKYNANFLKLFLTISYLFMFTFLDFLQNILAAFVPLIC